MILPIHICPKCKEARPEGDFTNRKGERTKNCAACRFAYRDRLVSLHQPKAKRDISVDLDLIARDEGYQGHPLARLLALSHLVGAKKALAIRDGRNWRGKRAWRAYYQAAGEVLRLLRRGSPEKIINTWWDWVLDMEKRDPNSGDVSSSGEGEKADLYVKEHKR